MKSRFFVSMITATMLINPVFAGAILSVNTTNLALSIKGLNLDGKASGQARHIIITNKGNVSATELWISYPLWPAGTSVNTSDNTCIQGRTLAAGDSCTITIIPGKIATSGSNNIACTTGIAPIPGVISVTANHTNTTSTNVVVLGYGCIYQGGYIYAIHETAAISKSIGGRVTSLKDQAPIYPNGMMWNAKLCDDYHIDSSGNNPCITGTCYNDWYLPVICEMGPDTDGAGCVMGTQNIIDNLPSLIGTSCKLGMDCLQGDYWSSTETSFNPKMSAWYESFASNGKSYQFNTIKTLPLGVRCSRALTF